MTTTENNNKNGNDATLEVVNDAEDMMEEGKVGEGMRQRVAKHPSALSSTNRTKSTLSATSKMYDVDGDGKLDVAEQAMRDMDTDNRGYLANEKVYKVMMEQMKLQQEVFGLKRMAMVFLAIVFILSLATLGTSFAAAMLAKDTNVENGNLVAKDGGAVVGTSNVAATFTVTEGASPSGEDGTGRSLQDSYVHANGDILIAKNDAEAALLVCAGGQNVFLKRSCPAATGSGTVIIDVPICSGSTTLVTNSNGPKYTITEGQKSTTMDCSTTPCKVTFPAETPGCRISKVDLKSAANYVILSKAGISTVPDSVITGNIAVSPAAATYMTGFGNLPLDGYSDNQSSTDTTGQIQGNGKAYASDYGVPTPANLGTAVGAMQAAYTDAAGRPNADASRNNLDGGILNGHVLTPGVYTFTTGVHLTGDIHFQGSEDDIFIIQMAGSLLQDADYSVILDTTVNVGTPKAENIFWQIAGHVTVEARAKMQGILLVATAVTFKNKSTLYGRILSQTAVSLDMATITQP
jgi:hypothetical protein